ncbi:MAG TPA: hypothetical protein P5277_03855 [Candidatus Paceibacterota bacterium]|nr:hypothetical protein [Candidatus Paceibacterota bacterium]
MKNKRGKSSFTKKNNYKDSNLLLIVGLCLSLLIIAGVFIIAINSDITLTGNTITGYAPLTVESTTNFIKSFIGGIQEIGKPIFDPLLGQSSSEPVTFSKILIFILVALVISGLIDITNVFGSYENRWLNFAIGIIVSILGIRFIPNDLITQIALPSSALVASIGIILPFIIYGLFVYQTIKGTTFRRTAWSLFGIVLAILWVYNSEKEWSWLYPAILGILIILIIFDAVIKNWWYRGMSREAYEEMSKSYRGKTLVRIQALQDQLILPGTTENRKDEIRRELATLRRDLRAHNI